MTVSYETYGNYILVGTGLMLVAIISVSLVARAKGVDISTRRFGISTGVLPALIFLVLPFWFTPASIYWKLLMTICAPFAGVANYLLLDVFNKALWGKQRSRSDAGDNHK
jgi:hypothetical protein